MPATQVLALLMHEVLLMHEMLLIALLVIALLVIAVRAAGDRAADVLRAADTRADAGGSGDWQLNHQRLQLPTYLPSHLPILTSPCARA